MGGGRHFLSHFPLFIRPGHRAKAITAGLLLLGFVPGFILSRWCPLLVINLFQDPHRTNLDDFQSLNTVSPTWIPGTYPSHQNSNEQAIVTSLVNDADGVGLVVLGHSIAKVRSSTRRIVIYLPRAISEYTLCRVQAAGWELLPVDDTQSKIVNHNVGAFHPKKYLKLWSWTLDASPTHLTSIVYLAPNTVVRQNFDELFDLPFVFGAALDTHADFRGITIEFNSGVMAFRPNSTVFSDMLSKVLKAPVDNEQDFLNLYYGQQVARLPHVYNGNLAIKARSRVYWDGIWDGMRVIQYTVVSPFNRQPVCQEVSSGPNPCTLEGIWSSERHKEHMERASGEMGGYYRREIELWRNLYNEAILSVISSQCKLP